MVSVAIHLYKACQEAIELYKRAFNARVEHIDYYDEAPAGSGLDETHVMSGKIMHSNIVIYDTQINMSDSDEPVTVGNALCLNVFMPCEDDVRRAWDVLCEEGSVAVPLGPQFFNPLYAAVLDKYGIRWQIMVKNW